MNLFALQAPATFLSWRLALPELYHHCLRLPNPRELSTLDTHVSRSTSGLGQGDRNVHIDGQIEEARLDFHLSQYLL